MTHIILKINDTRYTVERHKEFSNIKSIVVQYSFIEKMSAKI